MTRQDPLRFGGAFQSCVMQSLLRLVVLVLSLGWIWGVSAPSGAQLRVIPEAARQVYELMPDLPRENDYVYIEEGISPPEDNTLVQRMMLYHQQVQGRPPTNRLDWQFTIADYLDLNEPMFAQAYPGVTSLNENPYRRDREVVQSLSREQRRQLLESILTAYGGDPNPPTLYIPPDVTQQAQAPKDPTVPTPDPMIVLPTTSSADLLK